MRILGEKELREYLDVARVPGERPEGYNDEKSTKVIMEVMLETGFIDPLVELHEKLSELGVRTVAASLWYTGVQMGREIEHRFHEKNALELMFGEDKEKGAHG